MPQGQRCTIRQRIGEQTSSWMMGTKKKQKGGLDAENRESWAKSFDILWWATVRQGVVQRQLILEETWCYTSQPAKWSQRRSEPSASKLLHMRKPEKGVVVLGSPHRDFERSNWSFSNFYYEKFQMYRNIWNIVYYYTYMCINTLPGLSNWNNIIFKKFCFIFNRRIITLQYCDDFCHTSTLIIHRYTHVPSLVDLPPTSLPIPPL